MGIDESKGLGTIEIIKLLLNEQENKYNGKARNTHLRHNEYRLCKAIKG